MRVQLPALCLDGYVKSLRLIKPHLKVAFGASPFELIIIREIALRNHIG